MRKALKKIAFEVAKELAVQFVQAAATNAGEALGKRVGRWLHPDGVDEKEDDEEKGDEDG